MVFDNLIRKSIASGSFYPADPDALRKQIYGFMDNAEPLEWDNDYKAAVRHPYGPLLPYP